MKKTSTSSVLLLVALCSRVKQVYDNRLNVPPRWDQSWMAPTLEALMGLTRTQKQE